MTTRPFSASAALLVAVLLIFSAVAAGAGPAAESPLVWVRQDAPVINVNNDPTFYESPAGDRFEGSFWEYIVDETAIFYEQRYVDHGYEWYHVTLRTDFDRPPLVINPPLRYQISAAAGHSATKTEGAEGVGMRFWYSSNLAGIQPQEPLAYYPWSPYFDGTNTRDWMIEAPPIAQEGQTFTVVFGWWNCPPCNVTWTYKAEPAYEVEQLGAEVVAPVVEYKGDEVSPGETFYPDTCTLPDGRAAPCGEAIDLVDAAAIRFKCASLEQYDRLLFLLKLLDIFPDESLRFYVFLVKMKDFCGLAAGRDGDDFRIGLALERGAFLLDSAAVGQSIYVHTALGTATADQPGAFAAGYQPDIRRATFRAYSAPLAIQPATGAPLTLQTGRQVSLTDAGFSPVTELPRALLPLAIR